MRAAIGTASDVHFVAFDRMGLPAKCYRESDHRNPQHDHDDTRGCLGKPGVFSERAPAEEEHHNSYPV